jgi:hypothetical protein
MKSPCYFSKENTIGNQFYQVCSCGKHIWCTKNKRVHFVQKNQEYFVYSNLGIREKISLISRNQAPTLSLWVFSLIIIGFFILIQSSTDYRS